MVYYCSQTVWTDPLGYSSAECRIVEVVAESFTIQCSCVAAMGTVLASILVTKTLLCSYAFDSVKRFPNEPELTKKCSTGRCMQRG
ncbi:hypothetical protein A0H81_14731 [Grifola frondosa]|uniref:Uncharacterized protein n=1 Tax=Grifola frondosa TaxID=5627 RepID=A0A1C7LKG7_GRIFR|nr:hypothetical protein A0H81_14731 [Grifola frondosa]